MIRLRLTHFYFHVSAYCDTREKSLEDLCNLITGDAPLYSMFRADAKPVTCPFSHPPFTFTYSRGSGECNYPLSRAEACTEDSRLLLKYQACADTNSEAASEELICLANWKDGSTRYLVGRLEHSRATSEEDRYRCFVYEKKGHKYEIAMSGDATCSGISSPTEGSRTITLSKEVQVKDKKINFKINMNLLRDKFELPCELVTNLFSSKEKSTYDGYHQAPQDVSQMEYFGDLTNMDYLLTRTVEPAESLIKETPKLDPYPSVSQDIVKVETSCMPNKKDQLIQLVEHIANTKPKNQEKVTTKVKPTPSHVLTANYQAKKSEFSLILVPSLNQSVFSGLLPVLTQVSEYEDVPLAQKYLKKITSSPYFKHLRKISCVTYTWT
ncbi:hypothetical protein M8J77_010709 [Diaphorina citri]|nr:hypothetical protein M8J77_010709 [Diaphorina citri]